MTNHSLHIRRMTRAELDLALGWAAEEGWNPGQNDANCFYAADPEGFFTGLLDGIPVGSISAVRYGDNYGFIGLFIVKPEHRGGRIGICLGKAALAHLGGRNIGLDGVLRKVDNYKAIGFKFAYKNIRFEGQGGGSRDGIAEPLSDSDFDEIAAYDAKMFGVRRDVFLRLWLGQKEAAVLGVRNSGRIAGYGVIRKCRTGYKIGPLFADDPAIAADLFDALAARADGEPFYLDVPEPNAAALELVNKRGMKEVFATARMYSKCSPPLPIDKIFGITTFELG